MSIKTGKCKPRLVVLVPTHWEAFMGGAQYQARLLIERLIERDQFEIHYVSRRTAEDFVPVGYHIHRIGVGNRVGGTFVQDLPSLWRKLSSLRPDVIYQRVGCAYTGLAARYSNRHQCRLVWHVALDTDVGEPVDSTLLLRNPLRWLERRALEYGIRAADAIVVQNKEQGQALWSNYGRSITAHIPNFHPLPRSHVEKPAAPVRVCWVANIKSSKRPELFVELARRLAHLDEVEWHMVGAPSPDPGEHDSLMRALQGAPQITFHGRMSQEEVNGLLEGAHVFVNTSLREGFANTFIQSWLRRVPVVSLSVNPNGVFDQRKIGFCANDSLDTMALEVESLVRQPDLRERMGHAAAAFARENFSVGNIDRLIELLTPDVPLPNASGVN